MFTVKSSSYVIMFYVMLDENPQVSEADLSWNILTIYFLNQLFTMSIRILQEYNIHNTIQYTYTIFFIVDIVVSQLSV